jgi:hypothetical protein
MPRNNPAIRRPLWRKENWVEPARLVATKWAVLGSNLLANEQLRPFDLARVDKRVRVAIGRHEPRALADAGADRGSINALAVEQRDSAVAQRVDVEARDAGIPAGTAEPSAGDRR